MSDASTFDRPEDVTGRDEEGVPSPKEGTSPDESRSAEGGAAEERPDPETLPGADAPQKQEVPSPSSEVVLPNRMEGANPEPEAPQPEPQKTEAQRQEPERRPQREARPAAKAPPAAQPEAAEGGPKAQWYAVRVQSNKEDSVKRNMERRIELRGLGKKIKQLVVPTEKVAEIKNGKKRTRQVKTYPGYVLVEMIMDDETWAFVRETSGVGDFVGGGGGSHQKPFPLRQDEVNKIFGLDVPGTEQPKIKIDFGMGDKVKIREGPFENFDGIVEEINEQKGTVRVVVTIFGRATPVELQYWQVETI